MRTTVFLADLRHNYGGVLSTDCMPLGVGFMKAVMDRDLPADEVDVRVFAYPDAMLAAMDAAAPHVVMVSNYVWNEELSLFFARHAKRLRQDCLTVVGGPNISIEPERQMSWLARHPEVDVYLLGEGDFLARDLVRQFLDADRSVAALGERELESCVYRRPGGEVVRLAPADRNRNVNDIPSPWLTGVMDQFFDGRLAPMIETNRGCPFRCTFCVQGTDYYSQINNFDLDRLRQEIHYIGTMIRDRSPRMGTLRIADPNYGMYKRDVEISGYIGEAQREFGWPTFIDATTGKNKPERIIESMEKVNGALVLYQAVQSLDDDVLRNIRRSNIKLEAYEKMQVHVRGRGLRSTSDLILGLPGESLKTHLRGLHSLIDADTNQAHCFQAMMLKGSEMETLETRGQFQFVTRFRVLPKNFGIYAGEKVFDIEEIIVATDTLPFEDYVTCRKHHFVFSVFWNDSWFQDVVDLARRFGIKPSEWLTAMLAAIESDPGVAGQLLAEFVNETVNELFPSKEACAEFYSRPENFERLRRGEIGDNLMYRYRARASFFLWKEVCACAMKATREMLVARGARERIAGFDRLWEDLHRWIEAKHASGTSVEEVLRPVEVMLSHDIGRWVADGCPFELAPYAFGEPRQHVFRLSESGARELAAALEVWTSQLTGLTKLVTRIRITSQVRACHPAEAEQRVG